MLFLTISVDDIRTQVNNDIVIKPYSSKYKIYIIPEADLMSAQAQNALLKTIEEPPEYAVIMLLTENAEALLPTIRSRCVMMKLRNIKDQLVKKYLMEQMEIPDYKADPGNLPRGRETQRTFIRRKTRSASGGCKTTGRCFVCVPETTRK